MGNFRSRHSKPPQTVQYLDLNRYSGKWYEIARFPQAFERGCKNVTAEYIIDNNGSVQVKNSCMKANGKYKQIFGRAKPAKGVFVQGNTISPGELDVSFYGPFSGPYWVFYIEQDYQYAIVGSPNLKNLWILSRRQFPMEDIKQSLIEKAASIGFDVSKLQTNIQELEIMYE